MNNIANSWTTPKQQHEWLSNNMSMTMSSTCNTWIISQITKQHHDHHDKQHLQHLDNVKSNWTTTWTSPSTFEQCHKHHDKQHHEWKIQWAVPMQNHE